MDSLFATSSAVARRKGAILCARSVEIEEALVAPSPLAGRTALVRTRIDALACFILVAWPACETRLSFLTEMSSRTDFGALKAAAVRNLPNLRPTFGWRVAVQNRLGSSASTGRF
jgi:hypothetical protein